MKVVMIIAGFIALACVLKLVDRITSGQKIYGSKTLSSKGEGLDHYKDIME